jgi:hypothetical protein
LVETASNPKLPAMSGLPSRRRVLLIAEAANPEWVSVPLEGWSHAQAIARVADAHLVTQLRNCAAIERAGLVHGRDFTAIDSELVARTVSTAARHLRGGTSKGWTFTAASGALSYSSGTNSATACAPVSSMSYIG